MKRGFPLKVEVLPERIMLNMAIRGERDRQKCSATEMLVLAVTITTPSGTLCMRRVRQIIVEEDMDHPLIGRPVLDEMGFVASQHLDSVRVKFHLHDFSHIGEELLEMGKQPSGGLSKLLLFCRPDQCSLTNGDVDDNSCWLVSSLPSLFFHDDFASRHLHIQILRNDYTVPTRCRHRGGMVVPLGCQACRAIR
jgi:hypothetical protein